MLNDLNIPDLTFPSLEYGAREARWDLRILLYKGGAAAHSNKVAKAILQGQLGDLQPDRVDLLRKLHEEIQADLTIGGSRETTLSRIAHLRIFFGWADRAGKALNLESIVETYCAWADSLAYRSRIKRKLYANTSKNKDHQPISATSAYIYCATVGTLLDRALERQTNVIELTGLQSPKRRKNAVGAQSEKQSLERTFDFGNLLQDICDNLNLQTVLEAPLPIQVKLRTGQILNRAGGTTTHPTVENTADLGKRYPLANLRIEAELMIFIAQTGMNLTQAQNLELRQFSYASHSDGFQVRAYKSRRGGAVLFEIFKTYRQHFDRYLEWRKKLFPNSTRAFPFIHPGGSRSESRFRAFRLRAICHELRIQFVGPKTLRSTRINWLLRNSADPDLTAEAAQHTKATLLGVYERPSLQRAMIEATRFWAQTDPYSRRTIAVAPGDCTGQPDSLPEKPYKAFQADCSRASGCLWCDDHRDVDSQNYVWALTSFRYLKMIELSKTISPNQDEAYSPAHRAVTRITEKLRWFENSNERRREWAVEAYARVDEGDFHPDWNDLIEAQESN